MTALYLSRKHSPECEYKHTGWGDAFSGAIKRPCASAYKLSAKSDSTGILCGGEVVWINPPLRVRAVWLRQQPGLLGLLKLIYKASVYSGFPRQGKVNNNGPLDRNKSQPGYMAHTAFFPSNLFMVYEINTPPPPKSHSCSHLHSYLSVSEVTWERSRLVPLLWLLSLRCPPHPHRSSSTACICSCMWEWTTIKSIKAFIFFFTYPEVGGGTRRQKNQHGFYKKKRCVYTLADKTAHHLADESCQNFSPLLSSKQGWQDDEFVQLTAPLNKGRRGKQLCFFIYYLFHSEPSPQSVSSKTQSLLQVRNWVRVCTKMKHNKS